VVLRSEVNDHGGESSIKLCAFTLSTALFFGIAAMAVPSFAANVDVSKCSAAKPWQDAYNKGDATAVAALYAADAIEVTPAGIRVGPAAVKERVEANITKDGEKNLVIIVAKCNIEGALRWSAGEWKSDLPQGTVGGFWTAIEAKNGITWKIQNLTFSVTPPPPPTNK
jgi:ketosteroid isomerase-like protein